MIEIDAQLRMETVAWLRDPGTALKMGVSVRSIVQGLLAVIDAKTAHDKLESLYEAQKQTILVLLKRSGWIEGPPVKGSITDGYLVVESNDGTPHLRTKERLGFSFDYPDSIARHFHVPPYFPPKREPVVEHKEGCKWKDRIILGAPHQRRWFDRADQACKSMHFCPGCGTKLPQLEK